MTSSPSLNKEQLAKLLLELVEKSRDVFWVRSPDYSEQWYLSAIFEEIWGRKVEELYKHPECWDDWLYPEDKKALYDSIAKRHPKAHPNDIFYQNYRIVRPNGELRWIRDQSFPIFDNNKLICFMGIAQDITTDKLRETELNQQKEKAEAANQSKTQLIRNLSHDIRTPLSGIIGMTELILAKINDATIKEELQHVHNAAQLLLNLLNEIMRVAQMELGEIPEKQQRFSLYKIIRDVESLFKPAAIDKNIQIKIQYSKDLPEYMIGNNLLVHQILMNLVGNAIKFTHQGEVLITAELVHQTEKTLIIDLNIKDTGIGIPENKQEFIFAPFNRLTPSFENKYKGSGLGLYMVAEYIRHLGGEIQVESKMGNGSTFKCTLPFTRTLTEKIDKDINKTTPETNKQSQEFETSQPNVTAETTTLSSNRLKILLLEDDLLAQKMGKGFFSQLGHVVTIAPNGMSALQETETQKFDLLVFDLGLPDIVGTEVAYRIRNNPHSLNQKTPIFALTAHADEQIKQECAKSGMQGVYDKPLTHDKAHNIIAFVNKDTELPILDLSAALNMMQNNEELMQQILETLISEFPERINALNSAYNSNNYADLQHHVHKLHGAISYCGAPRLKEAAKSLEMTLLNKQFDKVSDGYQILIREIENFIQTYKQIKKNS